MAQDYATLSDHEIAAMSRDDLRTHWSNAWKLKPPFNVSTKLLAKSLLYKAQEKQGYGLSHDQKQRLDQLVRAYKRNRTEGTRRHVELAIGTKLIRTWRGKQHTVTVMEGYFEYNNTSYKSLSAIACEITNSHWNGWKFFDVKKPKIPEGNR